MPRKYNPYLGSMVQNYRDLAKSKGLRTDHLTNEQMFAIIDANSSASTGEETTEWTLQDIAANQPNENKVQ